MGQSPSGPRVGGGDGRHRRRRRGCSASGRHAPLAVATSTVTGPRAPWSWSQRSIAMPTATRTPGPPAPPWPGDHDAGKELAERGIQAAPFPTIRTRPAAGDGSSELMCPPVAETQRSMALDTSRWLKRSSDPLARWTAVTDLIEGGLAADRGSVPAYLDRLSALAREARRTVDPQRERPLSRPERLVRTGATRTRPRLHYKSGRSGTRPAVRDLTAESMNLTVHAFAATALRRPSR